MTQTMTAPPRRRWVSRARRVLTGAVLLAIVVFGARAAADVWTGHQLDGAVARIEKDCGPLQYDAVRKIDPWRTWPFRYAPDNRARVLDAAAASVTASDTTVEGAINWTSPFPAGDLARRIVAENPSAVQLALRAATLRHSNWAVTYIGEVSGVPNLPDHHRLSRVLIAEALAEVDAGQPDRAAAAIGAGLAQAAAIRREPAVIMTINGAAMTYQLLNALQDMLERTEPSGAALAGLAAALGESRAINAPREALLGELRHARFEWRIMEQGWLWGRRSLDNTVAPYPTRWMRAAGWFFRPIIRWQAVRDLANRARAVEAAGTPRARRPKDLMLDPNPRPRDPSERPSPLAWAAGIIDGDDWLNTRMGLGATAVALRRFRIDHGAYPAALEELVPAYLQAVPLDPFAGGPPAYSREGAGFALRVKTPDVPLPPGARRPVTWRDPSMWKQAK